MHPLSLEVMTWSWGLFGAVTFVACVVRLGGPAGLPPEPTPRADPPRLRWLTPGSALLGIGETFAYGAYAGFAFTLIHNTVLRRTQ